MSRYSSARGSSGPEVRPRQLDEAASACRAVLDPFAGTDWTIRAGDLDWNVRSTVAHTADALGWYAAHLAAASPVGLLVDFRAHDDASNAELLDVLAAAAAMLTQVARAAPDGIRGYHSAGMADVSGFLAMGCDEMLVHCWDAARGLGIDFVASAELAECVLRRLFPWAPGGESPWPTLLWANGRTELPGRRRRLGSDWAWHCAPLAEWDGATPRAYATEPLPVDP